MPQNEYKPYKVEDKEPHMITNREAVLLSKLRKYAYGKFIIHKVDAVIIRLEINDSQIIKEDTNVELD